MSEEAGARRGLFVGLCTLDVIQLVERLPGPDEKVGARDVVVAAGGPAANAAIAFAALGGVATLVTRVGRDATGSLAVADLEACGVRVVDANVDESATTTVASILVTAGTGQRAVVSAVDRGRAADGRDGVGPATVADLAASLLDGVDVVLVDSYETDLSEPLAQAARRAGVPVLWDSGTKKPWAPTQLRHVDCAVVSETYVPGGPAAIAADLAGDGVRCGVVTAGAGPVTWWRDDPGALVSVPVPPVEVVDTLGAGDFFHGALAYSLAGTGLTADGLAQAVPLAAHVAGLSVQDFGSRSWLCRLRQDGRG